MGGGFANPRLGLAISAGTALVETGTVVLSNSNDVSFGMQTSASSFVITASITGTGIPSAIQALSAGTTAVTHGQAVFGTGGLSFGANGQTITASPPKVNYWANNDARAGAAGLRPPSSSTTLNIQFARERFWFPIDATRADMIGSLSVVGSQAGSYTIGLALYTFAGSTAGLVSSASAAVSWTTGTNETAVSVCGAQSGLKWRSMTLGTWAITPGDYLMGFSHSMSGVAGTTATLDFVGARGQANTIREPAGGVHTNYFASGFFSAASAAFPASMHLSALAQTWSQANNGPSRPWVRLAGTF